MKVFDFDNTIYDGESMVDFFYFMLEKKPQLQKYKPLLDKVLFLYQHNLLPMKLVKNLINSHKNDVDFNIDNYKKYIEEFWKVNSKKIRKDILAKISKDDVIMSASVNVLFEPIKKKLKAKNIYTSVVDVEKKEILFICYKENKLDKFKEVFKDKVIDELYTDSYADKPLMSISKKVFLIDRKTKEMKQIKQGEIQ